MTSWGVLAQLAIAVCGIASVVASQSTTSRVRRWACVFGIAAQPAWFYATLAAEQWGMFALSLVYACAWARGIWNFWVKGWAA